MVYKYLYIDDTSDKIEQGTINGLQDGNELEIQFKFPNNWDDQMAELVKTLPNYHGLILDLKLNVKPYAEDKYANYRGSTVAQELRTLVKENGPLKKDFPIVLISADEAMDKSLDQTSLDLFDECISKNIIGSRLPYSMFKDRLKWLAEGYLYLNACDKNLAAILKVPDALTLDLRFIDKFNYIINKQVIHVIARFLLKEVIKKPTFLINEDYLAARLGIDKSSEDWKPFLEKHLASCKYLGAFSSNYTRWWMPLVESFWKTEISPDLNFRNTESAKKIELIIEKTGFQNLIPIKKQEKSRSNSFWVVCKATKVPIDTIDGFLVSGQDHNFPWQEPEYISVQEALRPTQHFTVSAIEKPRLQILKDFLEQNEQRVKK